MYKYVTLYGLLYCSTLHKYRSQTMSHVNYRRTGRNSQEFPIRGVGQPGILGDESPQPSRVQRQSPGECLGAKLRLAWDKCLCGLDSTGRQEKLQNKQISLYYWKNFTTTKGDMCMSPSGYTPADIPVFLPKCQLCQNLAILIILFVNVTVFVLFPILRRAGKHRHCSLESWLL